MNPLNIPVYTSFALCKDCYKCVRECTVKAIKIEHGQASIIKELCIHCGHCVDVCPVSAKKMRDDVPQVIDLLASGAEIVVSLAPSWASEFPKLSSEKLIQAFLDMGFKAVSETALGAEFLNYKIKSLLKNEKNKVWISTACPSVVEMIQKHYPEVSTSLTPLLSPLLIHSQYLKETYGNNIKIVFFGPCISKKTEADNFSDLLDYALTFNDLRTLWAHFNISPDNYNEHSSCSFTPHKAGVGAYYPIDGGMIKGIIDNDNQHEIYTYSITGLKNIQDSISHLDSIKTDKPVFLELLACDGGCINGPGSKKKTSLLKKNLAITINAEMRTNPPLLNINHEVYQNYNVEPVPQFEISDADIKNVFNRIGKYHKSDELNCGACGYDTCRECAIAIVKEKAEDEMCVSYLRKLAQNKINALFKTMPSAVVIVNDKLQIVECNDNFLELLDLKEKLAIDHPQDFEGAELKRIIDFPHLFESVLTSGEDIIDKNYTIHSKVLNLSIFTIEKYHLVGAVLLDITESSTHQDKIIKNAKKVIRKNLDMASKIAYLLGENVAEIETALSNIIESFDKKQINENINSKN